MAEGRDDAALTIEECGVAPTDEQLEIVVARIRDLADRGRLEAKGDLARPEFSEARFPQSTTTLPRDGASRDARTTALPPMTDRPSEDDLIARYFAPLAGAAGLALKDDAALMTPPKGSDLVLTVDALVAGVHFFADDPPDAIARKALRVNLSDLAAKGARPLGFLLALALPADWTADWLGGFAKGLGADGELYDCPLLGGDTVKTPGPLTLSITAFGAVRSGRMPARTGARPGDLLYVSGTIGDAALGLAFGSGG